MIKIAMCIRNRLEVTKKAIHFLMKHTKSEFQLYLYDNLTTYRRKDHFDYMCKLFDAGIATQITFNTEKSTFSAFSKAVALNSFGRLHEEDPKKDQCEFILFIDNDIIVQPKWDLIVSRAWQDVIERNLNNIKVIGQHPGGCTEATLLQHQIAGYDAVVGKFGGSGFWAVQSNFYRDVGFLDLKLLVGLDKKHDQHYWTKLNQASNSQKYLMVMKAPLALNGGNIAGSICNVIGYGNKSKENLQKIEYSAADEKIGKMSFSEFYETIKNSGVKL
ncbi:hypothetical protein KAR91_21985 [Candidatus Pacearchaeota archaeon]|nr:hypothetical protein [Candidatus Pacearchaeota archaeon]